MKTTVKLQNTFSYALWPIIITGVVVGLIALYFIIPILYRKIKGRKKKVKPAPVFVKPSVSQLDLLKKKYIAELYKIGDALNKKKINTRQAYQKMSSCIRHFVFDATGIKVQNYTLSDINALGMPILSELIAEYYTPEFAKHSYGNVGQSIEKARWVIERWN